METVVKEDRNPFEHGPYVQVAAFCERVLREVDGVISLIRIVDVINHSGGADPPKDMPPFRYPLILALTVKSGKARGRHEVTIIPELPSGETMATSTISMQMEGEGRGTNIVSRIDIEYTMEGLYWFAIRFDDQILTRLPLQVRYTRQVTGSTTPHP